jgi:hypothetical protein
MKITSQSSSATQITQKRNLSTQAWIYHKSLKPHKEVLGRAHKGFRMSIFIGGTDILQKREGKSFYTCLKKLAIGN